MATNERGWQVGQSFAWTNKHMFEHELGCDVKFSFPQQGTGGRDVIVMAHKYILVSRSPVFEAMLCGEFTESSSSKGIVIKDVEPSVFKEMLRFLYCDEAKVTADNVLHIMFAGKKYHVDGLVDKARKFLESELDDTNVCTILNHSFMYDETDLVNKCLKYAARNIDMVLEGEDFLNLTQATLYSFLAQDNIRTDKESDLLSYCVKWAENKKQQSDARISIREILGKCLFEIRFMSMSSAEFAKATEDLDILTDKEKVLIYSYLATGENKEKLGAAGFNTTPRGMIQPQGQIVCQRFDMSSSTDGRTWGYTRSGKADAIDFKVDTPIEFCGVTLYGGRKRDQKHTVILQLYDGAEQKWLDEQRAEITSEDTDMDNTVPIVVRYPARIKPGLVYSVRACIQGPGTYFGKCGQRNVTESGVQFEFLYSEDSTNGTTISEGQIPGIIFQMQHGPNSF